MLPLIKTFFNIFETHKKSSWFVTIVIAIAIFYISSLSFPPGKPAAFSIKPYLYHFFSFFFFALFLLIAMLQGQIKNKAVYFGIALAILYAVSDEIHQLFIVSRSFAIDDILTDAVGALSSAIFYVAYTKFRKRKIKKAKQIN